MLRKFLLTSAVSIVELKRSVQIAINGSYSSRNYPGAWFCSYILGAQDIDGGVLSMVKLTNQTSVNSYVYYAYPGSGNNLIGVGIVDDANQNGANNVFEDMVNGEFTDPFIATNSDGSNITTFVPVNTNVILYTK
ncbi:MAG: hypothetical protein ABDH28_07255 [Brevinematia bacterium]